MQKIVHLHRLTLNNRWVALKYLIKRVCGIQPTLQEKQLNEFYFHLIEMNGCLVEEDEHTYTSNYNKLQVKLRKRPSSDLNVFAQIFHYNEYLALVETFCKHLSIIAI